MAHLTALGPSREAADVAAEMGRAAYSRSSFEVVSHLVGDDYVNLHAEIEDLLIEEVELPDDASTISASIDRVSVPMEEPRPRPVGRPKKNAPKRPCEVVYRMAYCGTLTIHDAEGEAIHSFRYGRMPGADPTELVEVMASNVEALLRKDGDLRVCLLADGAPELWNLLRAKVNPKRTGKPVWELIDLWHLVEKLSAAARVVFGAGQAEEEVRRWKIRLLNKKDAALEILEELRASGREHVDVGGHRPVHDAITYLERYLYSASAALSACCVAASVSRRS